MNFAALSFHIRGLTLLTLLAAGWADTTLAAAVFAVNRPAPIWISSRLAVASVAEAKAALAAAFPDAFDAHVKRGDSHANIVIANCRDYVRLVDSIVGAASDQEFRVLRATGARCVALDALQTARPAERSFVAGFGLDQSALRFLPARLALTVSPDDEARLIKAEARQTSLKDFQRDVRIRSSSRNAAVLTANYWTADLTIDARGDFDGDGIEDLLITRRASLNRGSLTTADVFILTRTRLGVPLRVLRALP